MNMNQFTQKSLAAIQGAQDHRPGVRATSRSSRPTCSWPWSRTASGLIPQLLTNMGLTVPSFQAAVQARGGEAAPGVRRRPGGGQGLCGSGRGPVP